MKDRFVHLRRVLHTTLFVLLLNVTGMTKMYAYDFSAVCPSGQTLYYNIIDPVNHYVELACPCTETGSIGGTPIDPSLFSPYWSSISMGGTWNVPQPSGNVILPENVEYNSETYTLTSIGNNAFINCTELTSIIIPSSVTAIGSGAFYECSSLTSVVLPDSLVSIGWSAFVWCTSLESIEVPNTVMSIGNYAFSLSGITSIVIPNAVTVIGEEMFAGCESLISVELPSTVSLIDDHAFALCNSLIELIVFAETPPTLGNGVFYINNTYESISVNVPCGKLSAYQNAVGWSQFINYQELLPYHLSITSSNPDQGTVQLIGEPDCEDATAIVGATANIGLGYAFTNWTENGEIVSTDNPFIFNLESDMDLVANFEEMQIYWRSYDFSAVCSTGQTLYYKITDSINHFVTMVFPIVSTTETSGAVGGDPIFDDYEPYWLLYSIDYTWSVPEPTGDIVLPETVEYNNESYTLTSIGGSAFVNCTELTSVTIPSSVTTIGREAFYGCSNMISIALPDSLSSIDQSAFVWCTSLESIEIPNTVTSIGDYAFSVSGITSMVIPSSVTTIGEELFAACESLTSVILPNTVTFIDDHAFAMCGNLTELIVFAETPPTLGNGVFYHGYYTNYINSVYVPCGYEDVYASVSWGGLNNFYGMCGGTVTLAADPEEGGTAIGGGAIEEGSFCMVTAVSNEGYTFEYWELSDGTVVSNTVNYTFIVSNDMALIAHFISNDNIAFSDANVKSICINHWDSNNDGELSYEEAASVTDLGSYFQSNSQITSFNELQYFTGLSFIGNAAFKNCTRLSSIVLPNSLTSIGDYAFYNCSKLKGSLTIPNSVTSIGSFAFYGCSRMTGSLTLPISVATIGDYAFYGCSRMTGSLTLPISVTTIGDYVFSHCSSLKGSLTIPNSVTSIGSSAFSDCSGFTSSLIIPNSVTSIGSSAFSGCSGFTGVLTIPNSVISIGDYAFYDCSRMTGSLTLPISVTTIGDYVFSHCSSLKGSLTIPNSVTSIGSSAFSGCSGLTGSLVIPNSVTLIGSSAFYNCCSFDAIIVETGNTVYDSRENCNALIVTSTNELILGCKNSIIPNSVTTIGDYAFYGCSGLTSIEIPNSVTSIGKCAFEFCKGLTFIEIPSSVTSIGFAAFGGCSGLSEVMILGLIPPTLLGYYSFNGSVCPIYVPYESLNDYKTAYYWSNYENRIFPMTYHTIQGYGDDTDGWAFIASPLVESTVPSAVDNMVALQNYDLFRFNQSAQQEWENSKAINRDEDAFLLANGQGYLYASDEDVTLFFKGEFNENESEEINLAYDENASFSGWNLVGNPFPVNAFANRSYYMMNEDGTAIEPVAVSSSTAISPCTGIMVKAEATDETVTFTRTAAKTTSSRGNLQITVSEASSDAVVDRAILSFTPGDELEKYVFNNNTSQLYLQQDGKDYAVTCANGAGELPVCFKASQDGSYKLRISKANKEFTYLHLIDTINGTDIDLLQQPSYSFESTTADLTNRFKLIFK